MDVGIVPEITRFFIFVIVVNIGCISVSVIIFLVVFCTHFDGINLLFLSVTERLMISTKLLEELYGCGSFLIL